MREIASILLQVEATSSKKEKEEILSLHKDNELLKQVLNQIFNPFIKTNIAKKKLAKKVDLKLTSLIQTFDGYLSYLSVSTGKDIDVANVQNYIASQPEEIRWLLEAMAVKTLKFGFTESTINKAFGYDFIPVFDVMLAEKWIETKKTKGIAKLYEHWRRYIGKRIIGTKKLDGNRAVAFVEEDGVRFYSREGNEFIGFNELAEAFSQYPKGQVYDGEFLAVNEEGLNSQDLFSKTQSLVKLKQDNKVGMEFHAFDILPIVSFKQGGFDVSCEKRKESLGAIIKLQNHPLIKYVEPLYIGNFDQEIIQHLSEDAVRRGEEGIMVQLAENPYECKRTFGILKVKIFQSADIRCLDIYEGKSGKNIGRLGGLVLDFKGHRVNVGGGLSDELRDSIWADPSLVVGNIIEIKYFEEFEDENGDLDLRFATFKTIRDDKTEPSYK